VSEVPSAGWREVYEWCGVSVERFEEVGYTEYVRAPTDDDD